MSDTAFVLIVEDERAKGEAIAEALARSKFACNVVDSGPAAIDSVRHRPPDVVITACNGVSDGCCPGAQCCDVDPDCDSCAIPTVSGWGMVVMTLLLLAGWKVYFGRRRALES